jgi:hypothetical protein
MRYYIRGLPDLTAGAGNSCAGTCLCKSGDVVHVVAEIYGFFLRDLKKLLQQGEGFSLAGVQSHAFQPLGAGTEHLNLGAPFGIRKWFADLFNLIVVVEKADFENLVKGNGQNIRNVFDIIVIVIMHEAVKGTVFPAFTVSFIRGTDHDGDAGKFSSFLYQGPDILLRYGPGIENLLLCAEDGPVFADEIERISNGGEESMHTLIRSAGTGAEDNPFLLQGGYDFIVFGVDAGGAVRDKCAVNITGN